MPGETVELEGAFHGPATLNIQRNTDGPNRCALRVPRKIRVVVEPPAGKRERLKASFYAVDGGSDLGDPFESLAVTRESAGEIYLPAGDYLAALTLDGWAPDLHWIAAEPGAEHSLDFRRRDGWSLALRTIVEAEQGEPAPVDAAEVEIQETEGFESALDPNRRASARGKTREGGIFLLSGVESPMITVAVSHKNFVQTGLEAVSSPPSTFHFFELALDPGGALDIELTEDGLPAAGRLCELQKPKEARNDEPPEIVWSGIADARGLCRAETLKPGLYSLRISRNGRKTEARREVELLSGQTAETQVDLRPILVTGRVLAGGEPAEGERLEISPLYPSDMVDPEVLDVDETDEEGRFAVTVGAAGTYHLYLVNADSRRLELDDDAEVDFDLSSFQIVGRVVDSRGEPLPEAMVTSVLESGSRKRFLRVEKDDEGGFRCRFPKGEGVVEIVAQSLGYDRSEPIRLPIREGFEPPAVELTLHRKPSLRGRVSGFGGEPLPNAWVVVYDASVGARPPAPLGDAVTDGEGRFELTATVEGTVQVFFGGRGCALGVRQVEVHRGNQDLALSCGPPAHLRVHLETAGNDPSMARYQPILLRYGQIVIPGAVLRRHALALGAASRTDGSGQLAVTALEAGTYDLFHGGVASEWNLQSGHEAGFLTSVHLDPWTTVGVEVAVEIKAPEPFRLVSEE